MQWIFDLKTLAVEGTGLAKDALHIYAALVVFALGCWLFGWKAWQWRALLPVLLVALANEASDIHYNVGLGETLVWQASVHDIVNTMILPLMLVMLARWSALFDQHTEPLPTSDEESRDEA